MTLRMWRVGSFNKCREKKLRILSEQRRRHGPDAFGHMVVVNDSDPVESIRCARVPHLAKYTFKVAAFVASTIGHVGKSR